MTSRVAVIAVTTAVIVKKLVLYEGQIMSQTKKRLAVATIEDKYETQGKEGEYQPKCEESDYERGFRDGVEAGAGAMIQVLRPLVEELVTEKLKSSDLIKEALAERTRLGSGKSGRALVSLYRYGKDLNGVTIQ